MDLPAELRDFLMSRRARLTPEAAGIEAFGGHRRVAGLRREEVAYLAGVSVDYYTRLERGHAKGVSAEVIAAVARALQLDDVEHDHLRNLVGASRPQRPAAARGHSPFAGVAGLTAVLDAIASPAFLQNERLDLVAANAAGRLLYPFGGAPASEPFNLARFFFLDAASVAFYRERPRVARNTVAMLRAAAGRNPDDAELMSLIGQLSTRSDEFRRLWAVQDVSRYRSGAKRFTHPVVGDLDFAYQSFESAAHPGLTMLVYTAEPDSPTDQSLRLLSSWTAPQPAPSDAL